MSEPQKNKNEKMIDDDDLFTNQIALNTLVKEKNGDKKPEVIVTYSAEQVSQLIKRIKSL